MIILDDFLDEDYLDHIRSIIPSLKYQLHGSDPETGVQMLVSEGDPAPHTDCLMGLSNKILNLTNIKNASIIRAYVNLNPQGEYHSGNWHVDTGDGSNLTAIFYPMEWNTNWRGGTKFEDGDYVDYEENRLVLFDGNINHRSTPHTHEGFRYSIVFKMVADWNEDSINHRYTLGS